MRRLRWALAAGTLPLLALAIAPSMAVTPAAAATKTSPTLDLTASAAVTAKGASWFLEVGFDGALGSGQNDLTIALLRTVKSPLAFEDHTWNFSVSHSLASFSTASGKGALSVPTQAKPVATVSLHFSETSKKALSCSSGSGETYDLSVTGTATLDTGSGSDWAGTVKAKTWKGATNEVTVDSGCVPKNICGNSMLATSGNGVTSSPELLASSGTNAGGQGENDVALIRQVKLAAPAGAYRSDIVADFLSKVVVLSYNAATKTMSVTTPSSGLVHGSGKLVAAAVFTVPMTCTAGTTKYKDETTVGAPAAWSGSISAKPLMGGTMAAPKTTSTGNFEVVKATKI